MAGSNIVMKMTGTDCQVEAFIGLIDFEVHLIRNFALLEKAYNTGVQNNVHSGICHVLYTFHSVVSHSA